MDLCWLWFCFDVGDEWIYLCIFLFCLGCWLLVKFNLVVRYDLWGYVNCCIMFLLVMSVFKVVLEGYIIEVSVMNLELLLYVLRKFVFDLGCLFWDLFFFILSFFMFFIMDLLCGRRFWKGEFCICLRLRVLLWGFWFLFLLFVV